MLKRKAAFDAKHGKSKSSNTAASTATPASNNPAKKQKRSITTTTPSSTTIQTSQQHKQQQPTLTPSHSDLTLYQNKQRTLILSTRGITYRDRHLMSDLLDLLPHSKKDNKIDTKHSLSIINELAVLKSCNNILFLEGRKHTDLYMWLSRVGLGAGSVKFLVQNVHTMAETKLTGNCMKYSRPLLVFDPLFDSQPHYSYIKGMLQCCMAAPKGHPKVKPFIDHVLSFFILDGRIWIRHYQIIYDNNTHTAVPSTTATATAAATAQPPASVASAASAAFGLSNVQLVEIGPRPLFSTYPYIQWLIRRRYTMGECGLRQSERAESRDEGTEG